MVGKIDGTPLGGPVRRTDGIAAGKASAPADGSTFMLAPVVVSSNTPDRIFTASSSRRAVV